MQKISNIFYADFILSFIVKKIRLKRNYLELFEKYKRFRKKTVAILQNCV